MKRIGLRRIRIILRARNIEIYHNRLLPASHQHRLDRRVRPRIQLLMRHIRRNVNKIPRPSLIHKLQFLAPAQPSPPAHNVNHRLKFPVMMRPRLRPRMDSHRSSPKLLRPHSRMRNSFSPRHPPRLRRVRVQLPAAHDAHAMIFPVRFLVHGSSRLFPRSAYITPCPSDLHFAARAQDGVLFWVGAPDLSGGAGRQSGEKMLCLERALAQGSTNPRSFVWLDRTSPLPPQPAPLVLLLAATLHPRYASASVESRSVPVHRGSS
jgi:hypothetical protein